MNTKFMHSTRGTLSEDVYVPYNYLLAGQVRVTVSDSDLCCCVCVTSFERKLSSLLVNSALVFSAFVLFKTDFGSSSILSTVRSTALFNIFVFDMAYQEKGCFL